MIGFEIDRRRTIARVVVALLAITLALVLLDLAVTYRAATDIGAIRRLFNMTREDGLASWFGVTVTGLAALTAWATWAVVRRSGRRGRTAGWLAVALFLSWMAVDDGAAVHERLGTAFEAGGAGLAERFPSYAWQVLLLPLFAAMGAFTLAFLWRAHPDPRARAATAAALGCFAVAVGIDFMEGLEPSHPANLQAWLARRPLLGWLSAPGYETPLESIVHFGKVAEEAIEIAGMTLLWAVLLDHLGQAAPDVRIRACD